MNPLLEIHKRVEEAPWVVRLVLRVWTHGVYVSCIFEHTGWRNGTDVGIFAPDIQGLIESGELEKAEGIASWTKGMGDGFYIQENRGCSWNDVGYTTGIKCLCGDDISLDNIMDMLKQKFDLLVEKTRYLKRVKKEHELLKTCAKNREAVQA